MCIIVIGLVLALEELKTLWLIVVRTFGPRHVLCLITMLLTRRRRVPVLLSDPTLLPTDTARRGKLCPSRHICGQLSGGTLWPLPGSNFES